jgi:hypothetical protein
MTNDCQEDSMIEDSQMKQIANSIFKATCCFLFQFDVRTCGDGKNI